MFKSRFLKLVGAVTLINILARLLGFAREVIIGYQYGTTYKADSIITAFTIPNFIYLVIGGAVTTAFISIYTKLSGETKERFVQALFTRLALIIGLITLTFMIFPKFWVNLFFSGMDPQALDLTSKMFLWTAPATFFLALSIVLSGLHNVFENYRLSTFSTFLFNLVYLVIGAGLTPWLMTYSYALGASVGAIVMVLFLMHYTYHQKLMSLRPAFHKMPETGRFLKLVIPLIFGGASIQFYLIIQRIYAAGLDGGAIASLNYASKMTQFPQAVLMASVTTIVYPMLAKAAGEGDTVKLESAYRKGFKMLSLILLPASLFLMFFAKEIISFIFQYGSFSSDSTNATYPLLQLFALTVLALALNTYITRFFYALENTVLPIILSIISIFGINIFVIKVFLDSLGAEAIAWGTIISTIVNTLLLLLFARTKLSLAPCSWSFFSKLVIFTAVTAVVLWALSLVQVGSFIVLVLGGIATAAFVGGGLKFIR
ncbi:murein biosynthesis integral membrane protein MurJ [Aciduricibacillus chroicocephali]|uniref:Murein biosynthesis integral membrane protein MurJ n=1 Tax=Aciduricibacillus chroicocephali TaxID=3054939 RepID=A0ABY9KV40_9BACI|nr:murein biosynthesis integral membrane protein MurJ [Bacillaceae bacterium 44XB]